MAALRAQSPLAVGGELPKPRHSSCACRLPICLRNSKLAHLLCSLRSGVMPRTFEALGAARGRHPQLRVFGAPSTASSPCYSSSVETSIAKGAAPKTKRAPNRCRRRRRAHGLACGWCGLGCRAARGSVHSCLGASGAHLEQPQHATRAPRPSAPSAHRGATRALHGKKWACSRTRGGSSCCAHKL